MAPFEPLFRNPSPANNCGPPLAAFRRGETLPSRPAALQCCPGRAGPGGIAASGGPRHAAGEIVLVHGLEGSGDAGYIRSLSAAALRAGFAAHRFHMRDLRRHGTALPHALPRRADQRSGRRASGVRAGRARAGVSRGLLAGRQCRAETGRRAGRKAARDSCAGSCGVSAPLDLAACARRIAAPRQPPLRDALRAPHARPAAGHRPLPRSRVRGAAHRHGPFDDRITAPSFGFGDAANYYRTQSAIRYLDGIRVPVLLVQAKDDTFVSVRRSIEIRRPSGVESVGIDCWPPDHGGHLGFLGRQPHRFWAEDAIMEWIIGTKS